LDWLPLNRKIDFTVNRLCSYRFNKARLTLHFWERNEVLERMLKECAVDDYEMTREYKPMRMRPGVVHINFVNEFNTRFLKVLITKHYGFENARPDTLNVTPFIDVMLVLLIIFMVVTPIVTSSVKVELPKSVAKQKEDVNKPIILSINDKFEIYLGSQAVLAENIAQALDIKSGRNYEAIVYFHVDKSVPYEILINAVERVKIAGYTKIAFSTKVVN